MTRVRAITMVAILALSMGFLTMPAQAAPSVVRVAGSQGNWQLTVDGSPYTVKGLTWGLPVTEAAARMPDLRSMGVNTSARGAPTAPPCRCSTTPRPTESR